MNHYISGRFLVDRQKEEEIFGLDVTDIILAVLAANLEPTPKIRMMPNKAKKSVVLQEANPSGLII